MLRINYLQLKNARLTQECNTRKDQAEADSEARRCMDAKLKQLEMGLHAAQVQVEKLEQQKIKLSSRAWSLRSEAERSSQAL